MADKPKGPKLVHNPDADLVLDLNPTTHPNHPPGTVSIKPRHRPKGWNPNPKDPPEGTPRRTLYHFTTRYHLPKIMREGVSEGDIPTTPQGGYNAPWLTDDPEWAHQDWNPKRFRGEGYPIDKAEVRLTVEIPAGSPLLWHWPDLARAEKMDEKWVHILNTAEGIDPGSHQHWYVFKGRIPIRWVMDVEFREGLVLPRESWGFGRSTAEMGRPETP